MLSPFVSEGVEQFVEECLVVFRISVRHEPKPVGCYDTHFRAELLEDTEDECPRGFEESFP
ncbi:hypothetical protein SAMN05421809_3344 [Natronorubrum daqingense]|uniref:Uncharacterized protein n=1 Tax=Natronorubrum daqingense TaxID=588898 RepID=A0A1N7FLI4_9EURY|nr:hypothetical protein BB347_16835 [Natronorubrum daqingense]SIS01209.1 hypothetical protein SAMN05421809_3344 [Natronorubrum daqingense]